MKILFTAEVASQHAARWVNLLKGTGWKVSVFQGCESGGLLSSEFQVGALYLPYPRSGRGNEVEMNYMWPWFPARVRGSWVAWPVRGVKRKRYEQYLARCWREIKPDIVHSLGLDVDDQNMGELIMGVKRRVGKEYQAPIVYSTWGADLDYYARLSEENRRGVEKVLVGYDYQVAECERDVRLAREMGFSGDFLGYFPGAGGVSREEISKNRSRGKTSKRRVILVKGRDWAEGGDPVGRAMTIMRAIERYGERLRDKGYQVRIMQASSVVRRKADEISRGLGLDIEALPFVDYDELLKLYGRARIFMAMTINDGLPNSLVEAMALGAFPIHSQLESVEDWIENGRNGLLVPAEDVGGVVKALNRAVRDDELVDGAVRMNDRLVKKKLTREVVREKVVRMYEEIVKEWRL